MIDLAIIGGGPAGTAAALEASRRGLSVAIYERDRFPREKVCGEFLSGESLPLLECEIPAALTRGAAIRRAEFISPRGRLHDFELPAAGRGLSRHVLDQALWQAASAAGVLTREGEPVRWLGRLESGSGCAGNGQGHGRVKCWEIESAKGTIETAKRLIIACGRWWALEGFPSPAGQGKRIAAGAWLGVKAHFSGVALRDAVEMYYFSGGYCGLAPIEDGLYNACCLVHRSLARDPGARGMGDFAAWIRAVARHRALDVRLRGAVQASATITTAPLGPGRRRPVSEGAMLAGDAAGFLDPFTGDGISMALHSGKLAAGEWARCSEEAGDVNANQALSVYRRRLVRAVRRSYAVAGLVRALVSGPAMVQASVAAALPWLGTHLHASTRWQRS